MYTFFAPNWARGSAAAATTTMPQMRQLSRQKKLNKCDIIRGQGQEVEFHEIKIGDRMIFRS
jgi:hypothetical protein